MKVWNKTDICVNMGYFFQTTIEKNSDPDFVRGSNQKQFTECDNAFMKN